jgi:hypothetical protein
MLKTFSPPSIIIASSTGVKLFKKTKHAMLSPSASDYSIFPSNSFKSFLDKKDLKAYL